MAERAAIVGGELHRIGPISGVDAIVLHSLLTEPGHTCLGRHVDPSRDPATRDPYRQQGAGRGDGPRRTLRPAAFGQETIQVQSRGNRFLGDRRQGLSKGLALSSVVRHPAGGVRMRGEVAPHRGLSRGVEGAVDESVQIVFGDGPLAHLTLRRWGRAPARICPPWPDEPLTRT